MKKLAIALIIALFSAASTAEGTDAGTYEDELVFHLVKTYAGGEAVWLGTGGSPFLGLLRPARGEPADRAVIILHSMGGHADWPVVIAPLRTGLPDAGWATLSIQLPVQAPQAPIAGYGVSLEAARSRIRSAIRFLLDQGYTDIVLIGYGFGATSAVRYLADNPGGNVRAFAGISMQRHVFLNPDYNLLQGLAKVSVPVLDIYGSRDYAGVLDTVDERRIAGKRMDSGAYQQSVLEQADHYFSGMHDKLLSEIVKWLDTIIPAAESPDPETIYYL